MLNYFELGYDACLSTRYALEHKMRPAVSLKKRCGVLPLTTAQLSVTVRVSFFFFFLNVFRYLFLCGSVRLCFYVGKRCNEFCEPLFCAEKKYHSYYRLIVFVCRVKFWGIQIFVSLSWSDSVSYTIPKKKHSWAWLFEMSQKICHVHCDLN